MTDTDKINKLEKERDFALQEKKQYENGDAKLYYALQRKMSEMADMLNKTKLDSIDLTDGKDKSFERIKSIWDSAEKVSTAATSLGVAAGITNNEADDINKPIKRATTPESIADNVGQLAGKHN